MGKAKFIPEFTTRCEVAGEWLHKGKTVMVRETLTGQGGEGIVLHKGEEEWDAYNHTRAKLYVQYIPKKTEWRVHVAFGKIFDVQRKAMDPNVPKEFCNFKVRNREGGFIYVRGDADQCPENVLEVALESFALTGLDFGAFDIIWNEYRKQAYVLEVNTAPGLEGQTGDNYANEIKYRVNPAAHKPRPAWLPIAEPEIDFDEEDLHDDPDFDDREEF